MSTLINSQFILGFSVSLGLWLVVLGLYSSFRGFRALIH